MTNEPLGTEVAALVGVTMVGVVCITGLSIAICGVACEDEDPPIWIPMFLISDVELLGGHVGPLITTYGIAGEDEDPPSCVPVFLASGAECCNATSSGLRVCSSLP